MLGKKSEKRVPVTRAATIGIPRGRSIMNPIIPAAPLGFSDPEVIKINASNSAVDFIRDELFETVVPPQ